MAPDEASPLVPSPPEAQVELEAWRRDLAQDVADLMALVGSNWSAAPVLGRLKALAAKIEAMPGPEIGLTLDPYQERKAVCSAEARLTPPAGGPPVPSLRELFDLESLLIRVDGHLDVIPDLVTRFRLEFPRRLDSVRAAADAHDASALAEAAHGLKGSAGSLAAVPLFEAAARLEKMGQAGRLERLGAILSELEALVERLPQALETLLDQLKPGEE